MRQRIDFHQQTFSFLALKGQRYVGLNTIGYRSHNPIKRGPAYLAVGTVGYREVFPKTNNFKFLNFRHSKPKNAATTAIYLNVVVVV